MLSTTMMTRAWKLLIYSQYCTGQARPGCAAITINAQISVASNNKGLYLVPTVYSLQVSQGSVPHCHDSHLKFDSDGAACSKKKRDCGEAHVGSESFTRM